MTRIEKVSTRELIAELAQRCHGGPLAAGVEFGGALEMEDLVAELRVVVRRHVPTQDERRYRDEALAALAKDKWRARRCCCSSSRKEAFSRHRAECRNPVAAVVVVVRHLYERNDVSGHHPCSYHFVCAAHREHHTFKPEYVLAVVGLPKYELDRLRFEAERERNEYYYQQCREEAAASAIAHWFASSLPKLPPDELAPRRQQKRDR